MFLDDFVDKALRFIPPSEGELVACLLDAKERFLANPSMKDAIDYDLTELFGGLGEPVTGWQKKLTKLWAEYLGL